MGAIPRSYVWALEGIITNVMKPRFAALTPPVTFTHEEFLELFAPEEDRHILREASRVAHVTTTGGYLRAEMKSERLRKLFDDRAASVMFTVHSGDHGAPLLPRNNIVLPTAPEHLVTRLEDFVVTQVEQNREVNRCHRLLYWLDANCTGMSQVRYLWPSILAICAMDQSNNEALAEFANRTRELKRPQALPHMPPEVRAAFKSTASIIAAIGLLPSDPVAPVAVPEVSVQLHGSVGSVQEGALGWIAGV